MTGRVLSVVNNGDIKIDIPQGIAPEVGTRFRVINDKGEPIAEIKVIRSDADGIFARHFRPFVSDDVLKQAASAGAGAAIGSVLGGALSTALLFDPVLGAVVGGVIGRAIAGTTSANKIRSGMRIVPIIGEGLPSLESLERSNGG
jgi:hypothetical protein